MNLKELAFPIRIYWDLAPSPEETSINHRSICDQIKEMKFFTLNLLDTGSKLSNPGIEIIEQLKNEMITVSLTVSPSIIDSKTIELLSSLNLNEILIGTSAEDDLSLVADSVQKYKNSKLTIGVSFQIKEDNYRHIPDVVSYCLNNNISRLVFPMQRITTKGDCFYVSREDGQAITARLSDMDFEKMKITIHDPFLWRIFYPAVSFPGGGCQAANSMTFISPDGKVYPCPTMPIELGDLNELSMKDILSSASKKELVRKLHKAPEECAGCDELSGCMGGCSGRVFVLNGSLDQRDPACM